MIREIQSYFVDTADKLAVNAYYFYCQIKRLRNAFKLNRTPNRSNREFIIKYNNWLSNKTLERPVSNVEESQKNSWATTSVSLGIAVNANSISYLTQTLDAINEQTYPNFEVCIGLYGLSNDRSFAKLKVIIKNYRFSIKLSPIIHTENLAEAYNNIFDLGFGEYFFAMRPGDLLEPQCLEKMTEAIAQSKGAAVVYVDEGKINNANEKFAPNFKSSWNPDTFLSRNYLAAGVFFQASFYHQVGQFSLKYQCAYLYDLLLKISEKTDAIHHVSEVLFHKKIYLVGEQRVVEEKKALERAMLRRKVEAKVSISDKRKGTYLVRYPITQEDKISIIIPSRDQGAILNTCLSSIHHLTTYSNYEIVLIDNGSTEPDFFKVVGKWQNIFKDRLIVKRYDVPFNYSGINNYATKFATGDYFLFLNNDAEVLTNDWLQGMLEHAQREKVGAVGAKLLYPNNRIQHAGVILGLDGIASHSLSKIEDNDPRYTYIINSVSNYTALTAACMMVKKSIFNLVGGFDEKFEVDFNDYDLCLKLRSKGYFNVYVPHVVLYHHESYSRGNKQKTFSSLMRYRKERKMFVSNWKEYIENDPSYSRHLNKQSDRVYEPLLG